MKLRLATLLATLIAALLFGASVTHATSIRNGSGYGIPDLLSSPSADVTQWGDCLPPGFGECDLVVQINSNAPDLGQQITITVSDLTTSSTGFLTDETGSSSLTYGLIDCPNSLLGNLGPNQSGPCTSTTTEDLTGCNLSAPDSSGTFALSTACVVAGETFYFDVSGTTVEAASIGPGTPTATPEPTSLALLAVGLISLLLVSRRSVTAQI